MLWPWQHREVQLLNENARLRQENALLSVQCDQLRRYDALLEKYHELVTPKAVTTPAPVRDLVMEAITEACGGDHKLRGIMAKQVMTDRAAHLSEAQIIARIKTGNPGAEAMA